MLTMSGTSNRADSRSVPSSHHSPELRRLRRHAALVRTLLEEELDRILPSATGGGEIALCQQLVEELAQLGHRVLECAATMTQLS